MLHYNLSSAKNVVKLLFMDLSSDLTGSKCSTTQPNYCLTQILFSYSSSLTASRWCSYISYLFYIWTFGNMSRKICLLHWIANKIVKYSVSLRSESEAYHWKDYLEHQNWLWSFSSRYFCHDIFGVCLANDINALRLLQELRFIVGVLSMASLTGAGAGTKTLSSCYSLKSHQ